MQVSTLEPAHRNEKLAIHRAAIPVISCCMCRHSFASHMAPRHSYQHTSWVPSPFLIPDNKAQLGGGKQLIGSRLRVYLIPRILHLLLRIVLTGFLQPGCRCALLACMIDLCHRAQRKPLLETLVEDCLEEGEGHGIEGLSGGVVSAQAEQPRPTSTWSPLSGDRSIANEVTESAVDAAWGAVILTHLGPTWIPANSRHWFV